MPKHGHMGNLPCGVPGCDALPFASHQSRSNHRRAKHPDVQWRSGTGEMLIQGDGAMGKQVVTEDFLSQKLADFRRAFGEDLAAALVKLPAPAAPVVAAAGIAPADAAAIAALAKHGPGLCKDAACKLCEPSRAELTRMIGAAQGEAIAAMLQELDQAAEWAGVEEAADTVAIEWERWKQAGRPAPKARTEDTLEVTG